MQLRPWRVTLFDGEDRRRQQEPNPEEAEEVKRSERAGMLGEASNTCHRDMAPE